MQGRKRIQKLYMMRTRTLGTIVNTSLYGGKSNQPTLVSELLRSSQVVSDIAALLSESQNYKIAFDNCFASPQLIQILIMRGFSLCVLSKNKDSKAPHSQMTRKNETLGGTFAKKRVKGEKSVSCATKWYEKRPVYVAAPTKAPSLQLQSRDGMQTATPTLRLTALPRSQSTTHSWGNTTTLTTAKTGFEFFHLAYLCVVNNWLEYRRDTL